MKTNSSSIETYSSVSSAVYDEAINKSFVYGKITKNFISGIRIQSHEQTVLDIGCGTGFVFEELKEILLSIENLQAIGIDPAEGMLNLAREKFDKDNGYSFHLGSFENTQLENSSVDKITSTLALHWVDDLEVAIKEMARVLKPNGSIDILMISKEDGAKFKVAVFETLKKHLNFAQLMKTAALVQRATSHEIENLFKASFPNSTVSVETVNDVSYGSFEEHMVWWKARSSSVIQDVKDKQAFMADLEDEMLKRATNHGIPFDSSCFVIRLKPE